MSYKPKINVSYGGQAWFIKGDTYPIRDVLKSAGFRWDSLGKQWWRPPTSPERISLAIDKIKKAVGEENIELDETAKRWVIPLTEEEKGEISYEERIQREEIAKRLAREKRLYGE